MRKKIDSRIRTLVENCVKTRERSLFVIVGDKGRDQVVNLHYMLSKTVVKARPSVLWCYKKDLYMSRQCPSAAHASMLPDLCFRFNQGLFYRCKLVKPRGRRARKQAGEIVACLKSPRRESAFLS